MPHHKLTIDQIDSLLPQTQCTDCGYNGCRPYAQAIIAGESINKCLPGGLKVLKALGVLCNKDIKPYLEEMQQKTKPKRLAIIRESECIGCTKCINACPVDAIVGTSKQMHTVINEECTGCALCIEPCPMDCIDMEVLEENKQYYNNKHARTRYNNHLQRLEKINLEKKQKHQAAKGLDVNPMIMDNPNNKTRELNRAAKRAEITAAVARAKAKKNPIN